MPGNDIGINFRVDAQTDGLKRASEDFAAFQSKLSAILGITDPEKAEQYWQEYNSGLEKAVDLMDQLTLIQKRQDATGGGPPGGAGPAGAGRPAGGSGRGEENVSDQASSMIRSLFAGARTTAGVMSRAGTDVAGAGMMVGESLIEKALKGFGALPMAAKIATGVGAGIVGAGILGNALSNQYEKVIPDLLEVTGALKAFGATAKEQGDRFKETLNTVTESSIKYNFTFAQGAETFTQIARMSGGRNFNPESVRQSAESVMRISRSLGYSEPIGALTELSGYALGRGYKGAEQYAMWSAASVDATNRLEEVAGAMQSIMSNVEGTGAALSPERAASTQKYLYDVFGMRALGQGGASIFSSLSSAVRGSTGLSSETDILKFRAARELSGGDNFEALKTLEAGFTPELFEAFKKNISGASMWDQIFLVSKAFGLNLTQSQQWLTKTPTAEEAKMMSERAGSAINETPEAKIIGAQEKIMQEIRLVGKEAFGIKYAITLGTSEVVSAILSQDGISLAESMTPSASYVELSKDKSQEGKRFKSLILQLEMATGTPDKLQNGEVVEKARNFLSFINDPATLEKMRERFTEDDYNAIEKLIYEDERGDISISEMQEIQKYLNNLVSRNAPAAKPIVTPAPAAKPIVTPAPAANPIASPAPTGLAALEGPAAAIAKSSMSDAMASEFIKARYGRDSKVLNTGAMQIAYIGKALYDPAMKGYFSSDALSRFAGYDKIDENLWTAGELDRLYSDVFSLINPEEKTIFGNLEKKQRGNTRQNQSLWDAIDKLMTKDMRKKLAAYPEAKRQELYGIETGKYPGATEADKAAGFSAADLQEVIKVLQAIANNTAPQAVVIQIPK